MPCLYGFIPQTYCAERVSALSPRSTKGDGDPLDICVVSERPISRAEITLNAWVVGGLQMVDGGEADDKIVAILEGDFVHGHIRDLHDLPTITIERIRHYFLTYKMKPGQTQPVTGVEPYGREHAARGSASSQANGALMRIAPILDLHEEGLTRRNPARKNPARRRRAGFFFACTNAMR